MKRTDLNMIRKKHKINVIATKLDILNDFLYYVYKSNKINQGTWNVIQKLLSDFVREKGLWLEKD